MDITITDIKDFPSQQAEEIQNHLKDFDEQGKLFDYFKEQYPNLGAENSLANYILKNWEKDGKKLYIEWTGIEVYKENKTLIKATDIKLNEISYGSKRYLLWKCNVCQYEWVTMLNHRTHKKFKRGCPSCAGTSFIKNKNDLETFCKEHSEFNYLLDEFMGEDVNGNKILPSEISRASNRNVWWHCSNKGCGHKWTAAVGARTRKNFRQGCPSCANNILIKGKNDLETFCKKLHPELNYILEEFTELDENSQPIKASEIAYGSHKRVKFKCRHCHKIWLTSPNNRTNHKSGCPYCTAGIHTSFPEQFIYQSIKQIFPSTENRWKDPIKEYEYDIMIPELKLCIEYSGVNWHADKLDRDQAKADHCKANKINFLQIYAHKGEITDEQGLEADDTYAKNQIMYRIAINKTEHIKQLKYAIEFILDTYAPKYSLKEIDFELAEKQANEVMGKA